MLVRLLITMPALWLAAGCSNFVASENPFGSKGDLASLSIDNPLRGSENLLINMKTPDSVALNGTCMSSQGDVTLKGLIAAKVPCQSGQWTYSFQKTNLPEGPSAIYLAQGRSNTFVMSVSKDTIPPVAALGQTPKLFSNATTGTWNVTTSDAVAYKYILKSGDAKAVDCTMASMWSSELTMLIPIVMPAMADGPITLCVIARDASENWQEMSSAFKYTWTKDTVPPVVNVNAALAINAATANVIAIQGTCSENGQDVKITGGVVMNTPCAAGKFTANLDQTQLPQGASTLKFAQTDLATNSFSTDMAVSKDTIPPVVTVDPTLAINAATPNSVAIQGTCSENGQDVKLSGGVTMNVPCATGKFTANIDQTKLPQGASVIKFMQTDIAMNSFSVDMTVSKDTILPVVTVGASLAINMNTPNTIAVPGTCSEIGQDVKISGGVTMNTPCAAGKFSANIDQTILPQGASTLKFTQTDLAMNTFSVDMAVSKDTIPPVMTISGLPTAAYAQPTITATIASADALTYKALVSAAEADCANVAKYGPETPIATPYSPNIMAFADGTLFVCAIGKDAAGNWTLTANAAKKSFVKDTQAPSITASAALAVTMSTPDPVVRSGGCVGAGAAIEGIAGTSTLTTTCVSGGWSLSFPKSAFVEGSSKINYKITKGNGLAGTAMTNVVTDTIPPTLVFAGVPAAVVSTANVTLNVSSLDGAVSYRYAVGVASTVCADSAKYSADILISDALVLNLTSLADGPIYVCAVGKDGAGNVAALANAVVANFNKDASPPAMTATPSLTLNMTSSDPVSVSGTCSADALTVVATYKAVIKSTTCVSKAWALTFALADFAEGASTINYTITKPNGLNSSAMTSVVKDSIPPTAVIAGQPTGTNSKTALMITVAGTDVVSYKYKVVPADISACANIAGYSGDMPVAATISTSLLDINSYPDGAISVCVIGRDAAGNYQKTTDATSATWTKDTGAPVLSVKFDKNYYDPTAASGTYLNVPTNTEEPLYIGVVQAGDSMKMQLKIRVSHNQKTDITVNSITLPANMTLADPAPTRLPANTPTDIAIQMDQRTPVALSGTVTINTAIGNRSFVVEGDVK